MSLRRHLHRSRIQVGRLGSQSWSGHQEGWQCTPDDDDDSDADGDEDTDNDDDDDRAASWSGQQGGWQCTNWDLVIRIGIKDQPELLLPLIKELSESSSSYFLVRWAPKVGGRQISCS